MQLDGCGIMKLQENQYCIHSEQRNHNYRCFRRKGVNEKVFQDCVVTIDNYFVIFIFLTLNVYFFYISKLF